MAEACAFIVLGLRLDNRTRVITATMDLKVDEKIISLIKVMIAIITFTIGGYIYLAYRSTSLQMLNGSIIWDYMILYLI